MQKATLVIVVFDKWKAQKMNVESSDKNRHGGPFFVLGLFLFLWLIAEGAAEYAGLHITLLVMSAVFAVLLNNIPPSKNSSGSGEF